jgi:disulfide bond formation protein DsbB
MSRGRVNGPGAGRSAGATLFAVVGLVCLAAVGAALVSQHMFNMQPCPWCVLQRVIFLAIAIACAIGFAWRRSTGRVIAGALGLLLAIGGIAAALWQHFQAAESASCNLTLADRITSQWLQLDSLAPDIFSARASCADAAVNLFGVPYDFWSLGLFVLIAAAMLKVLATRR